MGGRYSTNGLIPCSIPGGKSSMPSFELLATFVSEIPFFYRRWAACMSYCPYVNTCWVRDWWLSSVCSNGTNRFKLFFLLPFFLSYFPLLASETDWIVYGLVAPITCPNACINCCLNRTPVTKKKVYTFSRPVLEKPKKAHSLSNTSPVIEKEVNKKFLTPKSQFEGRS